MFPAFVAAGFTWQRFVTAAREVINRIILGPFAAVGLRAEGGVTVFVARFASDKDSG